MLKEILLYSSTGSTESWANGDQRGLGWEFIFDDH